MKTQIPAIAALLLTFLALPQPSDAVVIFGDPSGSTSMLGNFEGLLTYTFLSDTMATLEIELTNTTPAATGGFLTAFVLNNPDDQITGITLDPPATFTAFQLMGTTPFQNGVSANPFGDYDFGASSTSGDFEGGGSPMGGIPVGSTETFTFSLTGTDLDLLTDLSFVNALPSGMGGFCCDEFMVVRFRGIPGLDFEQSDKVPADFTPIPEPSTLILIGLGMVGLVLWKRRRAA